MKAITEAEFQKDIQEIYETVFGSDDAYDSPFQDSIQPRLLLYPYSFGLKSGDDWLEPVLKAIQSLGENGFYVTIFIPAGKETRHFHFTLDEMQIYYDTVFPRENAIYSTQGKWGIVCSEEDHAIAGGNTRFINHLKGAILDWEERTFAFVKLWEHYYANNHADVGWMPTMLSHVFGEQKAKEVLLASRLSWLIQK